MGAPRMFTVTTKLNNTTECETFEAALSILYTEVMKLIMTPGSAMLLEACWITATFDRQGQMKECLMTFQQIVDFAYEVGLLLDGEIQDLPEAVPIGKVEYAFVSSAMENSRHTGL